MAWDVVSDGLVDGVTILVDRAGGVIEVGGAGVPHVRLVRNGNERLDPGCLIGTREATRLALRIDGADAEVRPGPGLVRRRSFRADVTVAGVLYRLTPHSRRDSVLLRDGVRIGRLTADSDALLLSAEWTVGVDVRPADAALGYLLAVSFGTGSMHPMRLVLEFLENLVPF